MHALPLALGTLIALVIARPAVDALERAGLVRTNYRGATIAFPIGLVVVAAAVLALAPLALLDELANADVFRDELGVVAVYALGAAFLGLVDDVVGAGSREQSRGWRGHGAALLRGNFSTGALKAGGSLGLAMYVLADRGYDDGEYLLAVALLVLVTNVFNLLDLRPGRALKAFALLGAGLTLGAWDVDPLWALGLFAGPLVGLAWLDLRERAMLGDAGSNLVGALAGLWLVLTLSTGGQAIALAIVLALTVYGEFRSISEVVERTHPAFVI